ncbi:type II toxin-antitoxin system PemK/MazF family toxin [Glycomyces niveus]|uniref:Type II toxin-antitoxin system PemK/MazF family toxin n=1 Tax=Glycomyces niveus TaxID=2820287 RepID=A0ABS3U8V1_9ACTN|nr:type II toxin-antitoxin system PemK/MazF family toxin [Glycomyces sp. NEAU-S30]MBO3735173.1 type II toxin-antitoxin system PemK/MazF family toxin [Glycomyces sp. NEAU-S30]
MIFRGAIYEIKPPKESTGHEQQGRRHGVVIQSDAFACSTITVALTSTSAHRTIYRPEIDFLGTTTRVLTDQIYSVDHGRLGDFMGALDFDEIEDLDRALLLKFALA